jgi:hypothetical protein
MMSLTTFRLGALALGLIVNLLPTVTAFAAEPFRLDRVAIVRYAEEPDGRLRLQNGVLDSAGVINWRNSFLLARPANTPAWALDRDLIPVNSWLAYRGLGTDALQNFELTEGAVSFLIGDNSYHFIAPSPDARLASGRVINISTRARLAVSGDVIAGFVIEERPRTVLVRVVGPGLEKFGVTDAAPDPALSVKSGTQTIHSNDNWSDHAEANRVRLATARVGAFTLDDNSRDAARLLRLEPGAYTVHAELSPANPTGGAVLVEVYSVPDDPGLES